MSEEKNEINKAVSDDFEQVLMALTIVQNQSEVGEFDTAIVRLIGGEQVFLEAFIKVMNAFASTGSFVKNYDAYILSTVMRNYISNSIPSDKAFVTPEDELTIEHKTFLANTFMFWINAVAQGDVDGVSLKQKFKIIRATHTDDEASILMLNFISFSTAVLSKVWNLTWSSENPNVFVNRFRRNMLTYITQK